MKEELEKLILENNPECDNLDETIKLILIGENKKIDELTKKDLSNISDWYFK